MRQQAASGCDTLRMSYVRCLGTIITESWICGSFLLTIAANNAEFRRRGRKDESK